jgi:hypothetical protein
VAGQLIYFEVIMAIVIQHPAMANRRAAAAQQLEANGVEDRGIRIPTRELKLHIAIIELTLGMPPSSELAVRSRRVRKAMNQRLAMYRAELAARDARRGAPVDTKQYSPQVEEPRLRKCM